MRDLAGSLVKVATIDLPASLENLRMEEQAEPAARPGMVKVRGHAPSPDFHDYIIATGMLPTVAGGVPVSDRAGEVVEVSAGVQRRKPGDRLISTFPFAELAAALPCTASGQHFSWIAISFDESATPATRTVS